MIKSIHSIIPAIIAVTMLFPSCSEKMEDATVSQGAVFIFSQETVYDDITKVKDIAAVKITLESGETELVLPTLYAKGDAVQIKTDPYYLEPGDYKIKSYKTYDNKAGFLFERENVGEVFTVSSGAVSDVIVPVKVKHVFDDTQLNYIKNIFKGFCVDVWGEDNMDKWPWDMEEDVGEWDHLEFEYDDYGNILYLAGIVLDGNDCEAFKDVTEIPDYFCYLETLEHMSFLNMPNLVKIPDDLWRLRTLYGVTVINTALESIPESLGQSASLTDLTIVGSNVSTLPSALESLPELYHLYVTDSKISDLSFDFSKLSKLNTLDLSGNPLTTLDNCVFAEDGGKLDYIVLRNTTLTSLPEAFSSFKTLHAIDLSGNSFTSVPDPIKKNGAVMSLWMENCRIASVSSEDIASMPDLHSLIISGNPLSSFPVLRHGKLEMLDVSDCGLQSAGDVSGMPGLEILDLGNNSIDNVSALDFTANPELRILSFAGNEKLTSLPDDIKLAMDGSKVKTFRLLDLRNCPALRWTVPAYWDSFDMYNNDKFWDEIRDLAESGNSKQEDSVETKKTPEVVFEDKYKGRVGIYREGSPGVNLK